MNFFRSLPVRQKLTLVILAASAIPLLIAAGLVVAYQSANLRKEAAAGLLARAELLAVSSRSKLEFEDPAGATVLLAALQAEPEIMGACLYTTDGMVFAEYRRPDQAEFEFPTPEGMQEARRMGADRFEVFLPVRSDSEVVGLVYLCADVAMLYSRLRQQERILLAVLVVLLLVAFWISQRFQRVISRPVRVLTDAAHEVEEKQDYSLRVTWLNRDDFGYLADGFNRMLAGIQERDLTLKSANESLRSEVEGRRKAEEHVRDLNAGLEQRVAERVAELDAKTRELERRNRGKDRLARMEDAMRGDQPPERLSAQVLASLTSQMDCLTGMFFVRQENTDHFELAAHHGCLLDPGLKPSFRMGEGVVGQAARDGETVRLVSIPDDALTVRTGSGTAQPREIIVAPLRFGDQVIGLIELGSLHSVDAERMEFFQAALPRIGIRLETSLSRQRLNALLKQTQAQAAELQTQREELRVFNEELQEQTHALESSREELQAQQEELQTTNEELEEQKEALVAARDELERRAAELSLASQFKSEFLANMSHELRTPLNSLLLLARMLSENREGNLTAKQVEYAKTILRSGSDLLRLINDILDLSKVEAGKMEMHWEDCPLVPLVDNLVAFFEPLARERGLYLRRELADDLPASIHTDGQRLEQILRNLLSNACKFTPSGGLVLRVDRPDEEQKLPDGVPAVAFTVIDTGMGIPKEKQDLIFESFRQADGSTSRRFGGTGLGLSISREFSRLLHGRITLRSEEGKGSRFTLVLPEHPGEAASGQGATPSPSIADPATPEGRRRILVAVPASDPAKALEAICQEHEFTPLSCPDWAALVSEIRRGPVAGILLDPDLAKSTGKPVAEALAAVPGSRGIPLHLIHFPLDKSSSGKAKARPGGARILAEARLFLHSLQGKDPSAGRQIVLRHLTERDQAMRGSVVLLVDDDVRNLFALGNALEEEGLSVIAARNGQEALDQLRDHPEIRLVLMDIMMPEMDGYEAIRRIRADHQLAKLPVIALTAKAMKEDRELCLQAGASDYLAKPVDLPRLLSLVRVWSQKEKS